MNNIAVYEKIDSVKKEEVKTDGDSLFNQFFKIIYGKYAESEKDKNKRIAELHKKLRH
jgi:hypothetical protein